MRSARSVRARPSVPGLLLPDLVPTHIRASADSWRVEVGRVESPVVTTAAPVLVVGVRAVLRVRGTTPSPRPRECPVPVVAAMPVAPAAPALVAPAAAMLAALVVPVVPRRSTSFE